ncbi:AIPR protein [Spirosoma sp. HMF3257]|uniref:AIPR protein n=1 Tax=Spirosoma telluris TaxID=2183553 RepID=A0A327NIN3_9BACT|nr:AIPR protein [Spirosoma telluris]RAI73886.1 AIPR protein [Spirosoma telluris]
MDLVTGSLLNTFKSEQGFDDSVDQPTIFEHFANFCVVTYEHSDDFDVEELHVAGGNDLQLDGIAIIVNGVLVNSIEEIDDLVTTNKFLDVEFIFIQAKSGRGFEGADISNMFFGVRDLFSDDSRLPRNDALARKEDVIKYIYSKSAYFKHGNPKLKLYYVTTGKWVADTKLQARIETEINTLEELIIFHDPTFIAVDARKVQQLYNRSKNALTKTINFANKVILPEMEGVREAYLGYIPVTDYVKLIMDENKNLLRGLFYDNVRDYQGENPVNKEIELTLNRSEKGAFVLLNNGVTIVSEDLKITGTSFTLKSFQIVNGCQTSHVLYNNQSLLNDKIYVSIKLIVAPDSDLKNQVIKATNRQTVVKTEELSALTDFQKHLEEYYNSVPSHLKLYYERRSQQFSSAVSFEKNRIVTIPSQIRSFASMFLGRAHQASRYYGTLMKDIEDKIFVEGHTPLAYYVSSYALFKIETALRKRQIDAKYRPFKFHLLGLMRLQIAGKVVPAMTANQFVKYCDLIKNAIWDEIKCQNAISEACTLIDQLLEDYDRDRAKDSTLESRGQILIDSLKKNLGAIR